MNGVSIGEYHGLRVGSALLSIVSGCIIIAVSRDCAADAVGGIFLGAGGLGLLISVYPFIKTWLSVHHILPNLGNFRIHPMAPTPAPVPGQDQPTRREGTQAQTGRPKSRTGSPADAGAPAAERSQGDGKPPERRQCPPRPLVSSLRRRSRCDPDIMVCSEINSGASAPNKEPVARRPRKSRPQGLPSPALCCACGLCIMLAGINITLVGAFAFTTLMPSGNPPIIIGPVLLLVAFTFFGACCVCSRLPPAHSSRRSKAGSVGFMRRQGAAFEIETSEHTIQDTTAVQLSPTNSPSLSRSSGSDQNANVDASGGDYPLFTMETNGPSLPSAAFSTSAGNGDAVKLTLPSNAT